MAHETEREKKGGNHGNEAGGGERAACSRRCRMLGGKCEVKLPSDSFGGNARDETSRLTFAREWPTSPRYRPRKRSGGEASIRINTLHTEVDNFQT